MYKLIKDPRTNEVCAIAKVGANLSFPLNPENTDYQAYLEWLAEGNVPLAADALVPQENGDTFTLSV
jgi:hypothetical protein